MPHKMCGYRFTRA